ncbi:MAG: DivIVA domain-containing protein [Bdellovibrionaceae bacterium]|nr:DivIVA domain-containing protein [Pseudobdellovibrionaceae bacterium]
MYKRQTPIDITHKSFSKSMFGFDSKEVMEFLHQVASQMEALIHERNALKETLREKEMQILEYKERDKVLKETISTAAQMSEKMKQDAEREAKLIITDAQQKAELITRDSRDSLKKIYNEIAELKKVRLQFEANLKALAQAHLTLLEQGEKFMPQMSLPNLGILEGPTSATPKNIDNTRSTSVSPLASKP